MSVFAAPLTSAGPEPMLRVRGLNFAYSSQAPVLADVDLNIRRGKIQVILGRSGSGKSTLLKILAGLLPGGRAVQKSGIVRTSYIPQSLGLVRNRTALENTLMGALGRVGTWASLTGFPKSVQTQARELLARLGLEDKADVLVGRLSGGQRQRVAIARALLAEPDVVLADEFVSQLDALTAEEVMSLTRKIADSGTAFIMTAHHPDLAQEQADRILILKNGRMVFDAPASMFRPQNVREMLG